ncbi:hypothetical protein IDAT_10875 [Pseudidiomarina atlantica]|uniref:Shikimate dehydrogenase (NADP(+)) n=1 Tax=Pseudidiomarina atlantica TaxID=1517416 RepID=A0A094IQE1_9GAMM|nr:shikimate dehydrogenase [Pseudidiomarina atlantica]KFZ28084.1 hypothetical protein IDAT_10875 [Pseudidiomarina atlantica]
MKHFTVFGNPISHSLSPQIHQAFAQQFGVELQYTRSLASKATFAQHVAAFFRSGGAGANVTVPFKQQTAQLVTHLTDRAARAGAVNTLIPLGCGQLLGDTTDGAGLLNDLRFITQRERPAAKVLIIGAGGAAAGVIESLQKSGMEVAMTNRTSAKVTELQQRFVGLQGLEFADLNQQRPSSWQAGDYLLVNATSASLGQQHLAVHDSWFEGAALAYDMMYAKTDTVFMQRAQRAGVAKTADGLGMLIEQAATAFALWHEGMLPNTEKVRRQLVSRG